VKEKLYYILNDKLFNIATFYKIQELDRLSGMPVSSASQVFDREIWRTYLDEMGFLKLILSGWFKNEELNGDSLECLSFTDSQGQKVDPSCIKENFIVIEDPLNEYHRVGIPNEVALKALSLGYFPDSPSVEKMRNVGSEGASLQAHEIGL
jgi:hypothetical protein